MNEPVVDWCRGQGLEVTRSRAYRKNDQAWVEQKNGAIVRLLVGYGRFEGAAGVTALARLYAAARLHTNLNQPSFKLLHKRREGARVIKRYHSPKPPAGRLLLHAAVPDAAKQAVRQIRAAADPVLLMDEIRAAQEALGHWVDRRGLTKETLDPAADVANLASAAQPRSGEPRTIHRRPYRRRKPIPKRPGMLTPYGDQIRGWMEADPSPSAVAVLERLTSLAPDVFGPKHLRTLQRAIAAERLVIARRLISEGVSSLLTPPVPPLAGFVRPIGDIEKLSNLSA